LKKGIGMTMQRASIDSGDHVVALAELSIHSATFAAATSLGGVLSRGDASGLWIMCGVFVGALVGCVTGLLFGRVFYPDSRNHALGVRSGRSLLVKKLAASFVPSAVSSFAVAIAGAAALGAPSIATAIIVAALASISVASIFGFRVARTQAARGRSKTTPSS
jgi:hypothetical protein